MLPWGLDFTKSILLSASREEGAMHRHGVQHSYEFFLTGRLNASRSLSAVACTQIYQYLLSI